MDEGRAEAQGEECPEGNYWKAFLVSLVIVFASEGYGAARGGAAVRRYPRL